MVSRNSRDAKPYGGIDRVDNRLGHHKSNSVPCCTICNRAKHAMTLEAFKAWARGLSATVALLEAGAKPRITACGYAKVSRRRHELRCSWVVPHVVTTRLVTLPRAKLPRNKRLPDDQALVAELEARLNASDCTNPDKIIRAGEPGLEAARSPMQTHPGWLDLAGVATAMGLRLED